MCKGLVMKKALCSGGMRKGLVKMHYRCKGDEVRGMAREIGGL